MSELRTMVFEQLDNAWANNYRFEGWSAETIVQDLQAYSKDCENILPAVLTPHVAAWLKERNIR